ncbi:KIN, antigenic determinant of recA protein-like protein [Basidiobolus meristosporus CBS 931.73]|uniref:KIN, antigenic determinant of recA protein-like protein n=1 Tax=Basidiobolus meristosporus CBS 931.73 TaxID=1314790 RepID=A0A1Y1XWD6_9FUNG|nr:KIN, antigenic determinant of recA protein-like protein [Basidiobolus meristosporus CBS 931.73]|eukprot:ORX90042.1 KIN, antigenic determinant of recA protein-like protein [Basidiobolus meristosporus CBS 931.73]
MGKGDFLTPKAIANRIKAKGLQKLRWYCQMCQKQCRDENGFKCHCASESHQRQMKLFAENPKKYMESFSQEFLSEFLKVLSHRHGTKRTFANQVYQELISDRNHLHMNATRWSSLTEFVVYLGKEGLCEVDETERGWFIAWIDRSAKALARQAAIQKKERTSMNDEEREKKLIAEQIARAKVQNPEPEPQFTALQRENENEKIKLNFTMKKTIKKPEVKKGGLKALIGASKSSTNSKPLIEKPKKLTALEEIILKETQRSG